MTTLAPLLAQATGNNESTVVFVACAAAIAGLTVRWRHNIPHADLPRARREVHLPRVRDAVERRHRRPRRRAARRADDLGRHAP